MSLQPRWLLLATVLAVVIGIAMAFLVSAAVGG
jgi:hypothetical protein